MKQEIRTVVYDKQLRLEAYRFQGIMQPFPSHFHEYYVVGFVERGERFLSCRSHDSAIGRGNALLFNPGGSHGCTQQDDGGMDYRGFNISKEVMAGLAKEITGTALTLAGLLISEHKSGAK